MTTMPGNDPQAAVPCNALPANCWSAIPDDAGARMLAMQYQLEQTQWWPAVRIPRAGSGKYEDFRCEISPAGG